MARIELRGETVVIDGYVNVTGRDSRPIPDGNGGYFLEQIEKGAFKKAIERAEEIKILLNHDWDKVLGSTKDNLTLREDVIGLRAHAVISDPEVVQKARDKRLRGWSFGFYKPTETRSEASNGMTVRKITDLNIKEVSLIDQNMRPWYDSTTVETRGDGEEMEIEQRAEEFEADYIGFEAKKPDNSRLKNIIEGLGGTV